MSKATEKALRRKIKSIKAAHAMHAKHPNMARDAGRKGAKAQREAYGMTPAEWGAAMAARRWSGGRTKLTMIRTSLSEEVTGTR